VLFKQVGIVMSFPVDWSDVLPMVRRIEREAYGGVRGGRRNGVRASGGRGGEGEE
jgi:choline dehydrogenase-like flavoprotein